MSTPTERLSANIVSTVATAETVLVQFEQALVQSGFLAGAEPYTRLADTLLGQRIWVESSGVPADARFHAVGARAQTIYSMLLPYTEAFRRISALAAPSFGDERAPENDGDGIGDGDVTATADDPLEAGILAAIDAAGRPLSSTALRAALDVPKAQLMDAVDRLVASGRAERHTTSGRVLVQRVATP